jgi:hypothetical protein
VFWFRQAVPQALRLQVGVVLGRPYKPCLELKWSLRTHDFREAKTRMVEAMAKAETILDAARNGAQPLSERQTHPLAGLGISGSCGCGRKTPPPSALVMTSTWFFALCCSRDLRVRATMIEAASASIGCSASARSVDIGPFNRGH